MALLGRQADLKPSNFCEEASLSVCSRPLRRMAARFAISLDGLRHLPMPSDGRALIGECPAGGFHGESDTDLLAFPEEGAVLAGVRPAEPRPLVIAGHRCCSTILFVAGHSEGRVFSHWSPMPFRRTELLFLSEAESACTLTLDTSEGRPRTSLSIFMAGAGMDSDRGEGDELRADDDKPS
jgi:hypothetical protein